jgi:N-acetylmuramoyl-L-alanine amidase
MPVHKVNRGEWMGGIAAAHGHRSWKPVWEHPRNRKLQRRRDPNLLVEGDRVYVPKPEPKKDDGGTDSAHKFRVKVEEDKLILRFVEIDIYLQLFGPIDYRIKVGRHEKVGELTKEGEQIKMPLPISVEKASLWIEEFEYVLEIGGLDPLRRLSGMQARINNLGWDAGPVDNALGRLTKRGTRDFQGFYKIGVDGKIGSETRGKIEKVYGC